MTEETKKKVTKKAASKKASKSLKVTQLKSGAGHIPAQIATLKGLGLGKVNRSKVLEDTPAVRGMIAKVAHLVTVSEEA